MKAKASITTIAKILFMLVLFYWLIKSGHFRWSDFHAVIDSRIWIIFPLLGGLHVVFSHWRWYTLLKSQNFSVRYLTSLPLTLIGMFFNFVVPGSVGGDFFKIFYATRDFPERSWSAGTTVLMDRLVGLWVMLGWALVATVVEIERAGEWGHHLAWILVALILAVVGLFFLASQSDEVINSWAWSRRILTFKWMAEFHRAFQGYRGKVKSIAKAALLSVITQAVTLAFILVAGQIVDPTVPWRAYFFAVPLGLIVSALPLAPAGIGIGQAAILGFLSLYIGHPSNAGVVGISLFQLTQFAWSLLGAYFYLRRRSVSNVEKPELQPTKELC